MQYAHCCVDCSELKAQIQRQQHSSSGMAARAQSSAALSCLKRMGPDVHEYSGDNEPIASGEHHSRQRRGAREENCAELDPPNGQLTGWEEQ